MPSAATLEHTWAGPDELLRLKRERLSPCVYHFYKNPPQIVSGRGCTLTDHTGRDYIDCYSGVTVMSAGHCEPEIVEPAIEQIRTLQHTTTIYLTEPQLRLAEALTTIVPAGLTRSFFCASGSEATEGAMLQAVLATERPGIVSFDGGLHGRTRWSMNATGLDMWRTDPFPLDRMWRVPFGDAAALERCLVSNRGRVAAVIGEPIQGNGGIATPPDDFWRQAREICTDHGVLLIFDEIQTGMNRTGEWFAADRFSVTPDILCVSKALGNGFPIAAFITTDDIASTYSRPGASTSGGNPVNATAALATIDFHKRHDLGRAARERGNQLRSGMDALHAARLNTTLPPRGAGLMLGLPIVRSDGTPDSAACDAALESLREQGVLAGKTGPGRNVLTFMPPLIIAQEEVRYVLDALDTAL
jgi:4-aminobutyrate aminotransferase/4-aminobutyrate aminotransferase/(S)-3-amino-2-methylpropionate transaminase